MNQDKVGKLIAKLRKEKGLTQSELGEMVGVGDRAVSKWERGLTSPNIAIINELSDILGISANELLAGELTPKENIDSLELTKNEDTTKKKSINIKSLLIIIAFIAVLITCFLILLNNRKNDIYYLRDNSDDYNIVGTIKFIDNNIEISINEIMLYDKELNNTIIKNYEYILLSNDVYILRNGDTKKLDRIIEPMTMENVLRNLKIYYKDESPLTINVLKRNGLILRFVILNDENKVITKELKIHIVRSK